MQSRRSILANGLVACAAMTAFPAWAQAEGGTASNIISIDDPRFAQYAEARRDFWSQLGPVDDDVISYLTSPQFQGLPAWPTTRQSYLVVRPERSLIIASDGLTDLFVNTNIEGAGFETEVYIEAPDLVGADFETIRGSWQFALIENFAQNVADFGGIDGALDRYGIISMELPATDATPQRWVTNRGSVGALINIEVPERPARCTLEEGVEIRMVPLTILLPEETEYVIAGRAAARADLAQRLITSGAGLVSAADRPTVLA